MFGENWDWSKMTEDDAHHRELMKRHRNPEFVVPPNDADERPSPGKLEYINGEGKEAQLRMSVAFFGTLVFSVAEDSQDPKGRLVVLSASLSAKG